MNNIFNLNPATSVLPFKWYPVTEAFRDFLREKTLPEGLCILDRITKKRIFIDHGVDRDIFIDNYLVGDFSVLHGKLYCEIFLENVIILGRQSVSAKILEAIESAPLLRREPFVADNLQFEILIKDVQNDGDDFFDVILDVQVHEPQDFLAAIKYYVTRLGNTEAADKAIGDIISELGAEMHYEDLIEVMKIAALMLEDKRSAERILRIINNTESYTLNFVQASAVRKYILNQKTENSEILQKSFSLTADTKIWLPTVRNLAMYFDFNYAKDVFKKGLSHLKRSPEYLDASLLAEFLLDDSDAAKKCLKKGKELAKLEEDAVNFYFYSITANKEKEYSDELLQAYNPLLDEFKNDIPLYLINVKYFEENPKKYHKLVEELIETDIPASILMEFAFELADYNAYADDLDVIYQTAKDRADISLDFSNIARWGMEYDESKVRESGKYLREADETAEDPGDHLQLGALLARNGKGKAAEKHLKKVLSESDDAGELIEIAEVWNDLDKIENAKRALHKAEKYADNVREFRQIATYWLLWFEDSESSKRCIAKAVEAGWMGSEGDYSEKETID